MAGFVNPIGKGLSPERIDMGVDYGGSGPLYALGSGIVTNITNSGWPGGTFLTIHLDDTGDYIYYAEDINPLVGVGQKVAAGQHIANATGGGSGIEVGWAAPPGSGNALAATSGQSSAHGDPGSVSSAYGVAMSNVIAALGGPAGKPQGTTSGTVPSTFLAALSAAVGKTIGGVPASSNSTGAGPTNLLGSIISFPSDITNAFKAADDFIKVASWIIQPSHWLRIGAFSAGIMLLAIGVYVLVKANDTPLIPDTVKSGAKSAGGLAATVVMAVPK